MKLQNVHRMLVAIACVGIVCPRTTWAAEPAFQAKDVALRPGGVLVGQVLDPQGAAQAGAVVSLQQNEQEIVRTTTDVNGIFAAQGLRGGQYQIVTPHGVSFYRLWAENTAPPAATDTALVISNAEVVRGQWPTTTAQSYGGRWLDWVRSHPYITAGVVAAAIATPLAIAATDEDDNDITGSSS